MKAAGKTKPKHGSAPAPHTTAYLHFCRARREDAAAAHPSWSVQQVTSELATQWKTLTASERKPWVELAQFDKARFRNEYYQYVEQQKQAGNPSARLRIPFKRKKNANEPRQPDTAYICFWKRRRLEVIAANPTLAAPLVSREVGRQWKALSSTEKQIWLDMAERDKLRFQEEIARLHPDLEAAPAIPTSLQTPLKDPYAPKPAKTAFQLFMKHNRESFTLLSMTLNEFRAEMSQLWKRLGDADKNAWYEIARHDQLRYEAEMNAYKPPPYMSSTLACANKRLDELKRLARQDPDAPQIPMSAYSFYLAAERHQMQERLPGLKHNEIMREMGVTWKAMGGVERAPYHHKAEQDVERFRVQMEAHLAEQETRKSLRDTSQPRKRQQDALQAQVEGTMLDRKMPPATVRKKRKSAPPRQPKTAYNLMYMSKRTELLATYQMSHNECSALCGRLWREMSELEREPYKRMAAEDKQRYQAELALYKVQENEESKNGVGRSPGFRSFLQAKRSENAGVSRDEVTALWKEMSVPQRVLWGELASDDSPDNVNDFDAEAPMTEEGHYPLEENTRAIIAADEIHAPVSPGAGAGEALL